MKDLINIFKQIRVSELAIMASITIITYFILFSAFDDPLMVFKGFIFTLSMIAASYCDQKSEIIPDILLIPIMAVGIIGVNWSSLAGAALSIPPLIISLLSSENHAFGGGDIKLIAACGFVLGLNGAVIGMLLGFSLFTIRYLHPFLKRKKPVYVMAPCFCTGCFFAFILTLGVD